LKYIYYLNGFNFNLIAFSFYIANKTIKDTNTEMKQIMLLNIKYLLTDEN